MAKEADEHNSSARARPYERERLIGAPDAVGGAQIPEGKTAGRRGFDPAVRETVIRAAAAAMETGGLEAVKARPIAKAAGISVGSIYNLFGDLDDLVRAVNGRTYDELYAAEMGALDAARAEGVSPTDQLLALAHAYLDFVKARQTRWTATLAFNRGAAAPPPRWYMEKELALFRIIEDALRPFPGAADANRRRLCAHALWASIHGIVTIAVADGFLMQPIDDVWEQIRIIVCAVATSIGGDG